MQGAQEFTEAEVMQWNIDIHTVFGAILNGNGERLLAEDVHQQENSNQNEETQVSIYSFTGEPVAESIQELPTNDLVESDFPALDDSLDAIGIESGPIFNDADGFWAACPFPSEQIPSGPKPSLLSNIPFLSGLISVDCAVVIALYANESPMRRPDIGRWVCENRLVLDREATVVTGQLGKIFDNDAKEIVRGKTKTRTEAFKVHKNDSMRLFQLTGEGRKDRLYSLTTVGTAYAELLLGSSLEEYHPQIKELLPLSARVRWLMRKYGAQTRKEYLGNLASHNLLRSACGEDKLSERGVMSGLANAKGFVSVNDIWMDQLDALKQWTKRFVDEDLAKFGMKIHEEAFNYYLKHDMKGCPTLVLVDESAFGNFFVQDGEGFRVIREMPFGTLVPVDCFKGHSALYSEDRNRELLIKYPGNHVSVHSFTIPSVPSLADQRFYCLGYHAKAGQRVIFSNLETENAELPSGTSRHLRGFQKIAEKFKERQDTKRTQPTPKKRSRRDASPKRAKASVTILNGLQSGIIPTSVIGGEELTHEQQREALNPQPIVEVSLDIDRMMDNLRNDELNVLDTLLAMA